MSSNNLKGKVMVETRKTILIKRILDIQKKIKKTLDTETKFFKLVRDYKVC